MVRKRSRFLYMLLPLLLGALIWYLLASAWQRRLRLQQQQLEAITFLEEQEDLKTHNWTQNLPSYVNLQDLYAAFGPDSPNYMEFAKPVEPLKDDFAHCQMETCFNFDKCKDSFKVYVYPIDTMAPISPTYEKILNGIMASPYYTNDPTLACLFILSIDTLDRDDLSREYVRNVPARLKRLPLWNNGENHIIFNLYAGTWPSYNESGLGFPLGKAILAKASMSVEHYRHNFDISIPLFHGTHTEKGDEVGADVTNEFPTYKKHLISFKGKRYVYGIGSDTRNSVYHLHNRNDVIMVTTCKHGKSWKEMKDDRCDEDNLEYEKYDYETLLQNSTFCLVPRGRRLGSFRFLEALRAGCIPVIISNGWILPFSEVIDWKRATIMSDERALLQTLDLVRSLDPKLVFSLKQQTQVIWHQYLSSMEKIIWTTFEIMKDRIQSHSWRDSDLWNSVPGVLSFDMDFADDAGRFPFHHDGQVNRVSESDLLPNFTAVIYVESGLNGLKTSSFSSYSNSPLFRLVKNVGKSRFVSKVLIIWDSGRPIPKVWPEISPPVTIKHSPAKSISQRFLSTDEIQTDAIFSLDEDTVLNTDELDFAYLVWRSFPDRIIGYSARSHYWDEAKYTWKYSSKLTNDYSLLLTGGAIYHVYYNHLYWTKTPRAAQHVVDSEQNCDDILINIIAAKQSRKSTIKLTGKKLPEASFRHAGNGADTFQKRQNCLNQLLEIYGGVPFKRSTVRLDPILFHDPVSNLRKKYRQLET